MDAPSQLKPRVYLHLDSPDRVLCGCCAVPSLARPVVKHAVWRGEETVDICAQYSLMDRHLECLSSAEIVFELASSQERRG
jgi:hypothetical protein